MTVRSYPATEMKLGPRGWLLYGLSGAGKTTLLGTFPGPIADVNFKVEKGGDTLRGHPAVQFYDVDVPEDVPKAIDQILSDWKDRKYQTIAIDSVTTWCELLYRLKVMKGKTTWEDWKNWKSLIFSCIERLRALPAHVVVTAGLAGKDDETRDMKVGAPAVFGSLAVELPARMENVIYLESETDIRGVPRFCAYPSGKGRMIGRVRGTIPSMPIESPTYQKIVEATSKPLFHGSVPQPPPEPPPLPANGEAKPEEASAEGAR